VHDAAAVLVGSAGITKEVKHQLGRVQQRRLEAINLGQMHPALVTPDDAKAAETARRRQQKLDEANERRRDRVRACRTAVAPSADTIFAMQSYVTKDANLRDAVKGSLKQTRDIATADVFVAVSPQLEALPPKGQLAECLGGAWIITPALFEGKQGSLKLRCSCKSWRRVHVTPAFLGAHKGLVKVLTQACKRKGSQIKVISENEAFLNARGAASAVHQKGFFILKKSSVDGARAAGYLAGFVQLGFQEFIQKVMAVETVIGAT
jgi:hypothetical protein